MKINITNKSKMIKIKDIVMGECFKYWPNPNSSIEHYHICMKTDGRFCITECMEAWPARFVDLSNGDEHGTSENTMVEPLSVQIVEN